MTAVGIIPARWASTRFPGKPLAVIAGRSMLDRVWTQARESKRLRDVIVATDDERIFEHCVSIGASVVRTSADHASGTDRIAEVVRGLDDDLILNIQGDEPLIEPFVIDALVDALASDPDTQMATVAHLAEEADWSNPNRVKVALDRRGFALYFSRACIPHQKGTGPQPERWLHVGLYAYRRDLLLRYGDLERGAAEAAEGLEQLRALENGVRIRVAIIDGWQSVAVDAPEDIALVESLIDRGGSAGC